MKSLVVTCALFICVLVFSLPAKADQWTNEKNWSIDYAKSSLGFTAKLADGTNIDGSFKQFDAKVDFDPENPTKGSITVVIDTNTITTNDPQRDSMLPKPEWFNLERFPQARFYSDQISAGGNNVQMEKVYDATGTLTIKNFKRNVTLPFTLKQEGNVWHAKASLRLRRSDFGLGGDDFADESKVKNTVTVNVDLIAKPEP